MSASEPGRPQNLAVCLRRVRMPPLQHVRTLYLQAQLEADCRAVSPDRPAEQPETLRESYNVAPTHVMPIIRPAGNGRELLLAGWGLVPFWMKAEQMGKQAYSTINAR